MAGRGPAPKDAARRARRNADPVGTTIVEFRKGAQPELPSGIDWPDATLKWWQAWGESPMSDQFTDIDWAFMLDTALLHKAVWDGDLKAAGELRLRLAKVGATAEDRARLRIQFANADEADEKRDRKRTHRSNEDRYGDLKVLPSAQAD